MSLKFVVCLVFLAISFAVNTSDGKDSNETSFLYYLATEFAHPQWRHEELAPLIEVFKLKLVYEARTSIEVRVEPEVQLCFEKWLRLRNLPFKLLTDKRLKTPKKIRDYDNHVIY